MNNKKYKKWAMLCSLIGFMEWKFHWKWEISFYGVESAYGGALCVIWCLQICLLCRHRGHSVKNCPNKNDETMDKKFCYNCGESGHSLAQCSQPLQEGELPFGLLYTVSS